MINQFKNLSCYEEFEIQCTLTGISKVDILKNIGHQIDNYYFFVSNDGVFNWYDLEGNYIKDPGLLKSIYKKYIPTTITKCVITDSVTSIGDGAFSYCTSLTSIIIPDSVIYIGEETFWGCKSLKEITIPNSITNIGNGAFANCNSLKEITIPDSVINIYFCAFANCNSLKEITIPDSVTSIGNGAFYACMSLKQIIFKGKTLEQIKQMIYYPFGIKDENIIKCEL